MLNQVVLVGKVVDLPTIKETVNGNKVATLGMELDRSFKNSDGYYETDYIAVTLWKGIAETVTNVCKMGDIIAVKGRVQTHTYNGKDDIVYHNYEFIAEKVSFLSNR